MSRPFHLALTLSLSKGARTDMWCRGFDKLSQSAVGDKQLHCPHRA